MKLMAKRKRPITENPTIAHDRRAKDTLIAGQYAAIDVPDPYDRDAKITVLRQLRNDPLARLHSHHQIDEAQYHAGRCYQRDWETAERGARAIDPTREAVDGGRMPEPLTDKQAKARVRLVEVERALGRNMHRVTHAVLIEGWAMDVASLQLFGRMGQRAAEYTGRLFRDSLDILAVEYKLAGKR